MKVIIDEREQSLYEKCYSIVHTEGNCTNVQLSKKVIPLGDILINTDEDKPVCIIERKSLSDLLASIKDGRYEEQSHRLLHASGLVPHNIIYIIEGLTSNLRSLMEKKIVYSSITSLNFFKGFSVFRTNSVQETAEMIVWISDKIDRNFTKGIIPAYLQQIPQSIRPLLVDTSTTEELQNVICTPILDSTAPPYSNFATPPQNYSNFVKKVKKDNSTPENIGEILLSQIPGISSVTAQAIMKLHPSFPRLIQELEQNPECLNNTSYESNGKMRKISKACIESIKRFLIHQRVDLSTS
jgi:ERCC4-type nuclease